MKDAISVQESVMIGSHEDYLGYVYTPQKNQIKSTKFEIWGSFSHF